MTDERLRNAERALDESDPASVLAYLQELRRRHGDSLPCPVCGRRTCVNMPLSSMACAFCGTRYTPNAHVLAIERLQPRESVDAPPDLGDPQFDEPPFVFDGDGPSIPPAVQAVSRFVLQMLNPPYRAARRKPAKRKKPAGRKRRTAPNPPKKPAGRKRKG